ncbi:hypothetical protein EDB80DRAFT_675910 [Ilyonectria destructans]|nr:hypothetical protein EDB80DRAFT_675910 [Ilyonectria destructans]
MTRKTAATTTTVPLEASEKSENDALTKTVVSEDSSPKDSTEIKKNENGTDAESSDGCTHDGGTVLYEAPERSSTNNCGAGYGDFFSEEALRASNDGIIDTSLISTRRTIEAQEGQVSIEKDDTMVLVDDANAYWWLIRAVKSDIIECVETLVETLAWWNKLKNVRIKEDTRPLEDMATRPRKGKTVRFEPTPTY